MKNIKLTYLALLAGLSLLWLAADSVLWSETIKFFPLRTAMMNYTGILAIGVMSVAVMLAARPAWVDARLGGLDKGYRLHKWLGITGLVIAVIHWAWATVPKWMVGWGWLERPMRGPRPEQPVEIFRFFQEQRGLAESIGEWAFYAAVVLIVLALVKRFPYRHFFKTHRVLAVAYLVLVVHATVLVDFGYWSQPVGVVMALLMAGGTVAACVSLFRRVGHSRKAAGEIEALVHHADNRVLQVAVRLRGRWAGHEAGQFAFVTFDPAEGPHPFTISSAWTGDGRLVFLIKALGDYTATLPSTLKVGDPVTVEGPYGRFDFAGDRPRQVWVAGGIGITPFIARLQALAGKAGGKPVDLFYSTAMPDTGFIDRLRQYAERAGVALHVLVSSRDGLLDAERIRRTVPDWRSADVWFCGPATFGDALRHQFAGTGLPRADFHQELFEMR
ncbi:ferredoxin reductase family protein [Pseudothauera rhizosphaerae]|uniref:Ferric reductase n=1 Tax=Pseudothauera rhizosphaerae TaxID=2565932 RepID=A0A4S4AR21_9RHOO|nr:ferric reductase-like transmembrane domain-containing protein [Pseudothauera rhizosphaerae]THF62232.1 ferric reductase [Pseudothauera rhizosphaerae]